MNERLKELAEQAGIGYLYEYEMKWAWLGELEVFAELVRQDEREACARKLRELKPVAWMLPEYGDVLSASEADGTGIYNIPLYTAPPRKEWVGLTDEDTANICMQSDFNNWHDEHVIDAVEAKLKENNGGEN